MAINAKFAARLTGLKSTTSNHKPRAGDTIRQISSHYASTATSTKIGLVIITKCGNGIVNDGSVGFSIPILVQLHYKLVRPNQFCHCGVLLLVSSTSG